MRKRTKHHDLNRADMCNGAEVTPQLTSRLKNMNTGYCTPPYNNGVSKTSGVPIQYILKRNNLYGPVDVQY